MPVEYQYKRGWFLRKKVVSPQRVSDLRRGCNRWKIGITSNPEERFKRPEYRDTYDRMIVMYQTKKLEKARELERKLIGDFKGDSDNKIDGGGGRPAGPPYYVYVVIQEGEVFN